MSRTLAQFSAIARKAVQSKDWAIVRKCADEIQRLDVTSPEGYFLAGLVDKAARQSTEAANAFSKSIELDAGRYDAAIELASQYAV
jgi:hypothetical protein